MFICLSACRWEGEKGDTKQWRHILISSEQKLIYWSDGLYGSMQALWISFLFGLCLVTLGRWISNCHHVWKTAVVANEIFAGLLEWLFCSQTAEQHGSFFVSRVCLHEITRRRSKCRGFLFILIIEWLRHQTYKSNEFIVNVFPCFLTTESRLHLRARMPCDSNPSHVELVEQCGFFYFLSAIRK